MPLPCKGGGWMMVADIHPEDSSLTSNEASLGRCWLELWKQNASMQCTPRAWVTTGRKDNVKGRWPSKNAVQAGIPGFTSRTEARNVPMYCLVLSS